MPAPKLSAQRARLCGVGQRGHQRPSLGKAHPSKLGLWTALLSAHPGSASLESTRVPLETLSHFGGQGYRLPGNLPQNLQVPELTTLRIHVSPYQQDRGTTHTDPGTALAQDT